MSLIASKRSGVRLAINAYKNQLNKEILQKKAKKGLLVKIVQSNRNRAGVLNEILRDSNNLNIMNHETFRQQSAENPTDENETSDRKNEDYLKKYYQTPAGQGPKHSIAQARAHHLTNFLTEFIVNAFACGRFAQPDMNEYPSQPAPEFVLELSRIELPLDLTSIRVHWLNSGDETLDRFVEGFLNKRLRNEIRQTLIQERVMSYVPRVVFVRDETNALMKKLDEQLAKVKIENQHYDKSCEDQATDDDQSSSTVSDVTTLSTMDTKPEKIHKAIDNLYGVEFNTLLEKIKTNTASECTKWSNELAINQDKSEITRQVEEMKLEQKEKFENSLRAYQVNKRLRIERLSKSALLKMSMLELEENKSNI